MFQKIKKTVEEFRQRDRKILNATLENEWANVYHDSIRGKAWLEELPLNIGRWAGNYAFFYVLNRVLADYKPKKILEFGLGESSKFINATLKNELTESTHKIIEESNEWKNHFITNHDLSSHSKIVICPLKKEEVKGFSVNIYDSLDKYTKSKFDLYVVDGPFGSARYSRYDIVKLAEHFEATDEFIIIFDDYNRQGEQDTVKELLLLFKKLNITIYKGIYVGSKRVLVLGTQKYKFIESF
ncbi:hypothetical protein [Pontimicrobium sp. SW4]|uniref:Class I SAM-dependent methyltransferase n=1 Tax=Pontimicrobium sp. SW4 TaxID=3153519 RepID=A0AAU7BUQ9_9FLAO